MKKLSLAAAVLAAVLSGCGTAKAPATVTQHHPTTVVTQRVCSGLTDTCKTVALRRGAAVQSPRGRIVDVSNWQGHPDWSAAKAAGIAGAIVKAGEYGTDPDAAWNAAQLRARHVWYAIYWYVRNTGCSHEAAQIVAQAHALRASLVANDLEAPEARGYASCLVAAERRAGLAAIDYTSPGTWPGGRGFGEVPLWQAEYGPTLHPFWRPVVAWQCTDGQSGCVTFVPGIGFDDVSINRGLINIHARVHCYGPNAQLGNATCKRVRVQVSHWSQARNATLRALLATRCVRRPPRNHTAGALRPYIRAAPRKPPICATLRQRAGWFEERVAANLY